MDPREPLRRRDVLRAALAALGAATLPGCGPGTWLLGAAQPPVADDPPVGEDGGISLPRHVLNRCTYGPRAGDLAAITARGITGWLDDQLTDEDARDLAVERLLDDLGAISAPAGEAYEYRNREVQEQVTRATLLRAVYARRQVREIVIGCWRDQFNVGAGKGEVGWLVAAYDREVVRAHALGSYRALLRASVTHPAMLWYLDGRTSRRAHPNENHARELLELHSLGVDGGYTQQDVMEVARCLTGWSVRPQEGFRKGSVEFHADDHDDGAKTVLGTVIPAGLGAGDVDRVVDLLAAHSATARRIARRLCARFIADDPPAAAVTAVAAMFTATGGDLRATVRAVFDQPAFSDPAVRLGKFKRPLHYAASCLRVLGVPTRAEAPILAALDRLGEVPWQHPTPEGYPEPGTAWTGTLWWRWHLAWDLTHQHIASPSGELALGRRPTAEEYAAWTATSDPSQRRTLLLACPAFQRF